VFISKITSYGWVFTIFEEWVLIMCRKKLMKFWK